MFLTISSPSFAEGNRIPDKHVRDLANLSPALDWEGEPEGTRSYAIIVEDPDAPRGTFTHWAVYDIPAERHHLDEGAGRRGTGLHQGANDFGNPSYDGPAPPHGHGPHHYHFRIAALNVDHLNVQPTDSAEAIWAAARPHMLAEAEIVAVYER